MCFSATASFTAAAVLALTGVISVASAPKKRWLLFALIPFLFSLQQFFEGVIWINGGGSGNFFLFFAFVIWPIWIPVSLLLIEKKERSHRILMGLTGLGVLVGIMYIFILVFYHPEGVIQEHHVKYKFTQVISSTYSHIMLLFYAMSVIGPFFVSSRKHMQPFGGIVLVTCLIALYFYTACFLSVWCFFAAIASLSVVVIMQEKQVKPSSRRRR